MTQTGDLGVGEWRLSKACVTLGRNYWIVVKPHSLKNYKLNLMQVVR